MLDDPAIGATLSPYLPSGRLGGGSLSDDFAPDPGAEPLWVLPDHVVPRTGGRPPGTDMARDRGYLDTPDSIAGVTREQIERDSARLYEGWGWEFCGPRPRGIPAPAPASAAADSLPTELEAGGFSYRLDSEIIEVTGGVDVIRGDQRVQAPRLSYDRRGGDIVTTGETFIEYGGMRVLGDDAEINLDSKTGRIANARYRFSGAANLRGRADEAILEGPDRTRYRDISYTTCPPGSNAWSLRAGELTLDQASGQGVARNARLRIRGVPVLYTPYLTFPIDDRRKSGFLIPSFGSSDDNGAELITPYYWNIAPNMDATFFPRYMSERGTMLGGEFRYLTRNDAGIITAEVLPNDAKFDGEQPRAAVNIEQNGRFFDRWRTALDYSQVSDDRYLEDLGNNLDVTSTRFLEQRGDLSYAGDGWSLLTRVQTFQTVDREIRPQGRPYGRLPQLLLTTRPRLFGPGLVAGLNAEYNFFDHNHRVHGQRLSAEPSISWPLRRSYGHLIPSATAYISSYRLVEEEEGQPSDPGHVIPSVDIDGRLVFERSIDWLGESSLQTLEPRLFYLYTPYKDQSDTPVFDSSELNFSFSNLFRRNRFTGRDRIGDANQLTAGLTSRTMRASTGEELFRFSIGQIFYLADRRVQIRGGEETGDRSPYAGELAAKLFGDLSARASFEWDPELDEGEWRRRTVQLEYRDDEARIFNLAYRADDTTTPANRYEDTDMSFRLPVGERVEVVGRWLYSMLHDETMDAFAGIEYGKCCWKMRLVGRHFRRRPEDMASTSVMLQVELAGLGAIGNPVGKFLEREIYGYETD
jgi:LPS-assembly protein